MNEQSLKFDANMMMEDMLGEGFGISPSMLKDLSPKLDKAWKNIEEKRGRGWLEWMELPYMSSEELLDIEDIADFVRKKYDNFVVLGIGGSALGPLAVHQALNHLHYNSLPSSKRKGPRLFVEDNIDPDRMTALLEVIDIKNTCFNVITKSGATAETMSQYLIVSEALKEAVGDKWKEHIIATTDSTSGNLVKLAKAEGFKLLYIPRGVGGRFSELSPVGLLAAAVCGIDIGALLKGAAHMDKLAKKDGIGQNPALFQAAIQFIASREMDRNILVMMPYSDHLKYISDWFAQLWAESLGKNITNDGLAVNYGQTPVKALGVTDQHSQLQLYTEGPYDKVITFLRVENFNSSVNIPKGYEEFQDISFLGNKSLNSLIEAEYQGTSYALYRAKRMHQTISLSRVTPYTIGQLLYFFQMTTAYMGELLNIDAFNQPGVEESKIATYAVLGSKKPEHVAKRREMENLPLLNPAYIIEST